ncbi:hypothetical protein [Spirillospora sp. CA-128828]|uniref:hypothetical protein n=1 Tax=Spirillospora sp. CA-128828 TaxID=3240033 RepID=UPI003D92C34C
MQKLVLQSNDPAAAAEEGTLALRGEAWAADKDRLSADDKVTAVFKGEVNGTHHAELTFQVSQSSSAPEIKAAILAAAAERQGATDEHPDEQR